jgi:uncharacterized iron-regulated membrane protein
MKKKNKKSTFRKVNDWLHLWLGLVSGIVVFIISITGCFYAFQQEIKDAIEPWRFVEKQDKPYVPPSVLLDTATVYMPGHAPTGLTYSHAEGAAAVGYHIREKEKSSFSVVFMNPYTGEFLKKQTTHGGDEFDFFEFIIDGHRALWLPYEIGRPIVGICTLIFVFLLFSGLIMWWPKKWNKTNRNKSFKIKWNGKFKRVNYDLHNVIGFYSLLFALVLGITGLVWSFQWFDKALYFVTSGGEIKQGHHHPHSDLSQKDSIWTEEMSPLDKAWYLTLEKDNRVEGMYMTPLLQDDDDPLEVVVYHDRGSFYDHNEYFYDRYTLEPLPQDGSIYSEASFADKLSHMNYDIHVGAIGGLAGKIFACLISLICASLPITGFLVWWNKRK